MRWPRPRRADPTPPQAEAGELPIPPLEMRQLVGPTDPAAFDNPSGELVYPYLPPEAYEAVFDFGCGCGRFARRLMLQDPPPGRYLGIDLHKGMIEWCRSNLAPRVRGFEFRHHDVYYVNFNPNARGRRLTLPFPAGDREFSMVEALSVFTHLTQSQAQHYLRECGRILRPDGYLHASWFLFDKREYPMLHAEQNSLYTNEHDLASAVIYDRAWLRREAREAGLAITQAIPPDIRGFHWHLVFRLLSTGEKEEEIPKDDAPYGERRAPAMPPNAARIGQP